MREMSQAARGVNWLITDFVSNVPGVAHTVVVSADGLPLAYSDGFPRDRADQLAAVAAGLISLTQGASGFSRAEPSHRPWWRCSEGCSSSCRSVMVPASPYWPPPTATWGLVAYQMTLLVERAGQVLTPAVRAELQSSHPR